VALSKLALAALTCKGQFNLKNWLISISSNASFADIRRATKAMSSHQQRLSGNIAAFKYRA
jgi:hypothetical protein